jgi:hypothetical protein
MDKESITAIFRELGDAKIVAVLWVALDIIIVFDLPGCASSVLQLKFHSVSNLNITMDFRQLVGQPLLWDAELEYVTDSWWNVLLDFGGAPDGFMRFTCCGITEHQPDLNIQ